MAVSKALRRLLRIRDLEEEQSRIALESSVADLHRLERALAATADRDRRGRLLVAASARSGEVADRLAGLEETRTADRLVLVLTPKIRDAEQDVALLREEYLAKRVERRQAETLIEESEAIESKKDERRGQMDRDDWFGNRRHRAQTESARAVLRMIDDASSSPETAADPAAS